MDKIEIRVRTSVVLPMTEGSACFEGGVLVVSLQGTLRFAYALRPGETAIFTRNDGFTKVQIDE